MIPEQGRDKQLVTWINIISLLLFCTLVERKKEKFFSFRPGLSCPLENILTSNIYYVNQLFFFPFPNEL